MDFVAAGIVLGFSIYEYYKDKIHDNTQTKILSLPRNKKILLFIGMEERILEI